MENFSALTFRKMTLEDVFTFRNWGSHDSILFLEYNFLEKRENSTIWAAVNSSMAVSGRRIRPSIFIWRRRRFEIRRRMRPSGQPDCWAISRGLRSLVTKVAPVYRRGMVLHMLLLNVIYRLMTYICIRQGRF